MIDALKKALLGTFGVSADEPREFYADVFLGAICSIALLSVVTLFLARHIGWTLFVAIGVFVACIFIASRKREVAAAALLLVAVRFAFAFFISFRLSALLGALGCAIAAGIVLRLMRKA